MKNKIAVQNQDFSTFVKEIKNKILSSQYEALKAVNKELIGLYWESGKNIVEKQEKFGWGKSVGLKMSSYFRNAKMIWKENFILKLLLNLV